MSTALLNLAIMLQQKRLDPPLYNWIMAVSDLVAEDLESAFMARNVVIVDIPDLTVFPIAASADNDFVTNVEGDVVLLTAQANPTEKGPYVVGASIAGATAPLTRPIWWNSGDVFSSAVRITVGGNGENYRNTHWFFTKLTTDNTFIVDDPAVGPVLFTFPETVSTRATLIAGTFSWTIPNNIPFPAGGLWGFSITRILYNIPAGIATTQYTINYPFVITGDFSTPGVIIVQAEDEDGVINATDESTLMLTLHNYG